MEYPDSKFTRPVRRALLGTFVALFCIIAPVTVMYTAGYRYDWKNGLLRETGAISIDILPKETTTYLDGAKLKEKIPVRLKNIAPKKYVVRLTAPGYYDWQKEVTVKSKQTVYIKEIKLIKKSEPQMMAGGKIKDLSLSADGVYLAYVKWDGGGTKILVRDTDTGGEQTAARLAGEQDLKITWAPDNHYLAISGQAPPYNLLILADAAKPERNVDLVKKIKTPILKFQWKETAEPELFYATAAWVVSYRPAIQQQINIVKNNFLDWQMENGQLWTLDQDKKTGLLNITRDALGFSAVFSTLDKETLHSEPNLWKLAAAQDNTVLLKNTERAEFIVVAGEKKFNVAGDKFLISKYNNWWLMWSPWELWTYTEGEEPYLLSRSGEGLRAVAPLDQYNTLNLVWNDKTTALFPYYLVSHDLLKIKVDQAEADTDNGILHFSAKIGDQEGLWSLKY